MFLKPWGVSGGSAPISRAYFTFAPGSTTGLVEALQDTVYPPAAPHCVRGPVLIPDPEHSSQAWPVTGPSENRVTGRQVSGHHCPNEEMETQKPPGLIQHHVQ